MCGVVFSFHQKKPTGHRKPYNPSGMNHKGEVIVVPLPNGGQFLVERQKKMQL